MILSGREIVAQGLVRGLRNVKAQQQPCGVDLTLRQVSQWTSAAQIDFDNTQRRAAQSRVLPFDCITITLSPGAYLVDFNETIQVPRKRVASIYPRSSLWRSGVGIRAGIIDSGYEGALGALLEVRNPFGIVLHQDSKLAQVVFEEMEEEAEGYKGIYQFSTNSTGRDGTTGT